MERNLFPTSSDQWIIDGCRAITEPITLKPSTNYRFYIPLNQQLVLNTTASQGSCRTIIRDIYNFNNTIENTGTIEWINNNVVDITNTLTSDGSYPWTYDENTGIWKSGNKNVDSSSSTLWVEISGASSVSFEWRSNGENNYDYLSYRILDLSTNQYLSGTSNLKGKASTGFVNEIFVFPTTGNYKLIFTYSKDSNTADGEDAGFVKEIKLSVPTDLDEETLKYSEQFNLILKEAKMYEGYWYYENNILLPHFASPPSDKFLIKPYPLVAWRYEPDKLNGKVPVTGLMPFYTPKEWTDLPNTPDYFDLGDTVHCWSPFHGLDKDIQITKISIPLNDPAGIKITLGENKKQSFTSTTSTSISSTNLSIKSFDGKLDTVLNDAKENAANIINSVTNGYVQLVKYPGNSYVSEIRISHDPDYQNSQRYWVWNQAGLAYIDNTQNPPVQAAITGEDGRLVINSVTTALIDANLIRTGTIKMGGVYGDFCLESYDAGGALKYKLIYNGLVHIDYWGDPEGTHEMWFADGRITSRWGPNNYDLGSREAVSSIVTNAFYSNRPGLNIQTKNELTFHASRIGIDESYHNDTDYDRDNVAWAVQDTGEFEMDGYKWRFRNGLLVLRVPADEQEES